MDQKPAFVMCKCLWVCDVNKNTFTPTPTHTQEKEDTRYFFFLLKFSLEQKQVESMLEIVKPFSSDPAIFKIRLKLFMAGFFMSLDTMFCVVEFLMVVIFKKYQIPSIPGYFPSFLLNKPTNKTPKNLFFLYLDTTVEIIYYLAQFKH